MLQITLVLHS